MPVEIVECRANALHLPEIPSSFAKNNTTHPARLCLSCSDPFDESPRNSDTASRFMKATFSATVRS